jgi:phage terminase large subunit-like protein
LTAAVLDRETWIERATALPLWGQARLRWQLTRRPSQTAPDSDWQTWLILSGRGWGKTRTGAEWIVEQAQTQPGSRWAVVAPTFADARDTCVEGDSGILYALGENPAVWNRSLGELLLANTSRIKLFSADEPDRLRGPQHHGAWCDELAAWRYPDAWDQLQFGLRLGDRPRTVVTTTPRPTALVRRLHDRATTHVTTGHTLENADNLAAAAVEELTATYAGTRLGRQELAGELLTDTPGALWTIEAIAAGRVPHPPADLDRVVVAVDPAVTSGDDSDLTGLVAVGRHGDRLYVLEDRSARLTPDGWAREAVALADRWQADRVVAEVNNGGDLVERVLRQVDRDLPYRAVRATRGKAVRAEPVAALYEQGRVHHVGTFDALEDQLCTWTPDAPGSPDRMDALVWACTDLLDGGRRPRVVVRAA